ncbi:sensor histidine kinase [Rubripirellula tenax]|nr:HAMP domain-containing sensor histidine kinase [Rubripirellula tenax]
MTRPRSLWCVLIFAAITTGLGLAMLSRHATGLAKARQSSEARENLQQNVRVALWRLDSRLGPMVATMNDQNEAAMELNRDGGWGHGWFSVQPMLPWEKTVPRQKAVKDSATYRYEDRAAKNGMEMTSDTASWLNELRTLVSPDEWMTVISNSFPKRIADPIEAVASNRDQVELQNRMQAVQQQMSFNQSAQFSLAAELSMSGQPTEILPVWVKGELFVVRSCESLQCAVTATWVDWPALKDSLIADVSDLLADVDIVATRPADTPRPETTLAALPLRLVVPPPMVASSIDSATATALGLAWAAWLSAVVLAALTLDRLMSLTQRRAAFVSAVTHELRTPLTTFRLYTDLLQRGAISDEEQRREYLQTLSTEADRLTHLVDNVLRYSKLQQTSSPLAMETVNVSDWIERIRGRLVDRLAMSNMTLEIAQRGDGDWRTDPLAMEQVLFNLIDNAAKYAVTATDRTVCLRIDVDLSSVKFEVSDHGPGVPQTFAASLFQPFTKSAERAAETAVGVGLGLALARQTMEALGGEIDYVEAPDGGAVFRIESPRRHS